ncbi:MAG: SDR family oxidoreductase [Rubrobacteraceae bacterium]|uniref:SDR family oxidoreductase n=1 Tax=Rubrobacter naiadicus TaxID=1392641 RepID=UPI00235F0C71|nr:SDR family oxidoreductase [Rubrobacter naiadicus]MCL6439529.1 SDR family oxidoreductase [Rubrobacteraceae bacterium]
MEGRVALVTGAGNPRGIGAAVCRELADKGMDVFFSCLEGEDPSPLRAELERCGVRAGCLRIDLAPPDSAERLLDAVEEQIGPPSVLVNNAARSERDGYENLDAATLDAHYAVNLRAAALLCAGFARRFRGTSGRIVNLTSGQSLGPMPGELAYAATKGALEAFTRTLAAELMHRGITANALDPGPTDTGWMSPEVREDLAARFPAGRVGRPEDAAKVVAFLAGEDSAWITGQTIHAEGGFLRG